MNEPDGSTNTSPLGMWGAELRYYRTKAGLSQEELGERISYSAKTVSAVETGRLAPSQDLATRCDEEFETGGVLARWRHHLVSQSALPTWFQPWPGVEAGATMIRGYEDFVMPGLVQTEAYARALLGADEAVEARLERQRILERDNPPPPELRLIIEESVLIRPVGDAAVMAEQIEHLISLVEQRPNIHIQIIPMGSYPQATGSFALATTSDGSVSYIETAARGRVLAGKEDLDAVEYHYGNILAEALPQRASLDMMKETAEKWRST